MGFTLTRQAAVLAAALWAAVVVAAAPPTAAAAERPGAACGHYDNRARFKARSGDVEFVTVLAEACAAARADLAAHAGPDAGPRRAAAALFIARLTSARAAIRAINRARLEAAPRLGEDGPQRRDVARALGLITQTGEFLILRHAGVFTALKAWSARRPDFRLAAALP